MNTSGDRVRENPIAERRDHRQVNTYVSVFAFRQGKPVLEASFSSFDDALLKSVTEYSADVLALLQNNSALRDDLIASPGQWIVWAVDFDGEGTLPRPRDTSAIRTKIKQVISRAAIERLAGSNPGRSEEIIAGGGTSGQLVARVLVLDNKEAALRDGELMTKKEQWVDTTALRAILSEMDSGPPVSLEQGRSSLLKLTNCCRETVATAFTPILNEQAAAMPAATYEEKKTLAKWVNAELRHFGLAIKGPDGQPCLLVATTGRNPAVGRFVFDHTDKSGRRHHPFSSVVLPTLTLMLDDLERSPYGARSKGR